MSDIYLKNPTNKDFAALEGKKIKSIKTNGNNSEITDEALESLSKVIGLESVDLEWATKITDNGLEKLSCLASLKYIDLSFCCKVTEAGISTLKDLNRGLIVEQ